jgi:cobalt/nickel transport protein
MVMLVANWPEGWNVTRKEIFIGVIIAVILAVLFSPLASSWPDGLEKVAQDYGFISKGAQGSVFKSPVAEYIFPGLKNEKMAIAVSGFLGTLVIFGIGYGLSGLLKKLKDTK